MAQKPINTKQKAQTLVRNAAAAAKKGEITNSQFRGIAAYTMAGELRSSLLEKAATYNKKYMQPSKSNK